MSELSIEQRIEDMHDAVCKCNINSKNLLNEVQNLQLVVSELTEKIAALNRLQNRHETSINELITLLSNATAIIAE